MDDELTLEDLANKSGLSLRTIRFYMQEGLLPGPDTRGKNARYSQKHMDRLELIQRFKDLYLPLQQIRHLLNNMTSDEIEVLLKNQSRPQGNLPSRISEERSKYPSLNSRNSALDYIRVLEEEQLNISEISNLNQTLKLNQPRVSKSPDSKEQGAPANIQETRQRIILLDGIELSFRIPLTSEESKKIDRLIAYARNLFQKE